MRNLLRFVIGAGLFTIGTGLFSLTLQAATVGFTVSPLGGNNFRYTYDFTALSLQPNQEVDIRFSPTFYSTLTNGVGGPGFTVALFQPNNPPGSFGDYSAFTSAGVAAPTGTFSVNFVFLGSGSPGSQPFFINQYLPDGITFDHVITSGNTGTGTAPEPTTWVLGAAGLLFTGIAKFARRRQ